MELDVRQARLLHVPRYGEGERGAEPHVHRRHSDAFYVLDGQITVRLGPELEPVVATAGTLAADPAELAKIAARYDFRPV
ncbi:MAG TPA: hypothetical protein VFA24_08030 [Gaiellaceae bacterium]|nr:hypothetical protein [Gaiellaceae bacterium]